ncbi:MAG: CDP-diacylglycerol--glycerol-3-phosphate 3-phosphatidyltransferase [Gemmatimonadetes bacterium]|nr:CDP-diacylglycerol--glycerol-3-phosphate 3-phosphatidyltransferase [Gemmatimonadota bacterium]
MHGRSAPRYLAPVNLPNRITLARIVACPVLAALILLDPLWARTAAFALFLVAAFSDVYDGALARRSRRITAFGKLADPVADKLLLASTFIPLAVQGALSAWLVLLVLAREILITIFRRYALARGRVISASPLGKAKALSQNWLAGTALFARILEVPLRRPAAGRPVRVLDRVADVSVEVLVWVVAVLTLLSLADYLYRNRALMVRETA